MRPTRTHIFRGLMQVLRELAFHCSPHYPAFVFYFLKRTRGPKLPRLCVSIIVPARGRRAGVASLLPRPPLASGSSHLLSYSRREASSSPLRLFFRSPVGPNSRPSLWSLFCCLSRSLLKFPWISRFSARVTGPDRSSLFLIFLVFPSSPQGPPEALPSFLFPHKCAFSAPHRT